jgi:streptogramin lyase
VWFSQPDNNLIGRITTTGQVTDYSGVDGVTNLAAGSDGNMWFLSRGDTGKIFKFDVQTRTIIGLLTPLGDQPGVTIGNLISGPGSYLWFTVSYLGYYIGRLDPVSGAINLYQTGIGNETPTGLTVAADGSLRFGYHMNAVNPLLNYIATMTTQGIETDTLIQNKLGKLGLYAGLTVDQNNNFWMTSYINRKLRNYTLTQGLLSEINPAGVVTRRVELSVPEFPHFNLDDMSKPGQIILGSDGALWFADVRSTVTDPSSPGNQEFAGEVGRFDPASGVFADLTPPTTNFVGDVNLTFALTSGPDGNIWFTEPDQDAIGKVALPKGSGSWQINGADKGQLYSNITFDSVQNLAGGLGGDTFSFLTGSSVSGAITGGLPTATLDFSQDSDPITLGPTMPGSVHGRQGTATPVIGNGFDNIDLIASHAAAGLKIDDTSNGMPTTWTVTASSVTRQVQGQTATTINFGNATSVEIDSGPGANTFIVLATATGIPLSIDGLGNDTVHVGNPTDGVGDILGAITVTGIPPAGRYTDLIVDDSAYSRGYWFATLSESSITTTLRTDGSNQVQIAPINYTQADLSSLTVLLGSSPGPSGNLVSIANTPTSAVPAGLMTTIDTGTPTAGAGADQVLVGATTGPLTVNLKGGHGQEGVSVGAFTRTLDAIRGAVTVIGLSGSGTNLGVYDDGNTTGEHYVVTNNTVVGRPGLPVITYHLNNELSLYASSGVNTIDVKSTSVATVIVAGLSGQDVVNVGDKLNTLNGVTGGYLDFQMVNPGNRVNFNDQGDPNNRSYDFALVGGYLPALFRTDSAGNPVTELFFTGPLQALSLRGSAGSDTYNVQYIQAPFFIHDHAGDVVNIGNAGSAQGILAPLSVDAGITMVVDDSADPTPRTFQVSPTSITGLTPAPINYGPGVANLTIDGGYGGNLIGVLNTAAKTNTTVNSGDDVDTVYVFATTGPLAVYTQQGGNPAPFHGFDTVIVGGPVGNPGTLDTIKGPLTINTVGRPGMDYASVAFFDIAATTPETYTITSNTILRSGAAPITYRVTNELEFRLGSGGNLVNIQSTFPGLPDLFVGGLGDDTFRVGDSSNTLNGIQSHLSFSIANPGSRVILHDEGDSANVSYTLAQDSNISPSNFVKRSNSGYYIFYSGPLKTLRIDAGGGNDSFDIHTQPPSSTTVALVGGAGSNTLQGPDQTNAWQITGANAGRLNMNVAFTNIQNLVGGVGNDAFTFRSGGSISNTMDGGGGINALDYSGYTGDVTVDLPLGSASLVNQLTIGSIFNIQNITGSRGNDLLVGDANANVLIGGTGRNILIGGAGADQLFGGNGDDILIGGTTDYDSNMLALIDFMTEWLRSDLDFGQRVADIFSGGAMIPDGKPASVLLGTGFQVDAQTVHGDQAANVLTGSKGAGHNWFFWDPAVDTLQKKKPGDILITV